MNSPYRQYAATGTRDSNLIAIHGRRVSPRLKPRWVVARANLKVLTPYYQNLESTISVGQPTAINRSRPSFGYCQLIVVRVRADELTSGPDRNHQHAECNKQQDFEPLKYPFHVPV